MKFLCFDFVLLLVIGLAWSLESTCPQLGTNSQCQCSMKSGRTFVQCSNLSNTGSLYNEIQNLKGYQIEDLELNKVQLPYLPAGLFSGTSIKRFHIVSSQLDNLYSVKNSTPSPFDGLQNSLEEVHVKYTKSPTKWFWPDLTGFKQMKKFEFELSPISFIGHVFAEIGGGSLEIITASHSQVDRIHPQGFAELTNLREANFDSNNLPYITRTMFPNPAPRLERINFRKNKIFTLEQTMFINMPALKYLDLSQNEMKSFRNVYFQVWNNLEFLGLSGNPFQCECNLPHLKEKVVSNDVPKANDFEDVTCVYGKDCKKEKIRDVKRWYTDDICI